MNQKEYNQLHKPAKSLMRQYKWDMEEVQSIEIINVKQYKLILIQ